MRPIIFRRYLECTVFVSTWVALGWMFRFDALPYNIVGAVLAFIFQRFVARRPLAQVWVRDAQRIRVDWQAIVLAGALAVPAALAFFWPIQPHRWSMFFPVILGCGIPALFAAFAIREQSLSRLRQAAPSFGAAVLLGFSAISIWSIFRVGSIGVVPAKLLFFFPNFALMFVAGFLLEEVVFRGVLDSHVAVMPNNRAADWISAVFIAVLWTVWHAPTDIRNTPPDQLTDLLVLRAVTPLVGVPLSFCWRRGGTLLLPSAAHALINAYRGTFWF